MAVQAQQQCLSHAFHPHHDIGHAFGGGGGMLLDALGVGGLGDAVFGGDAQQPRSELTCTGTDAAGFLPRKRARVAVPQGGFVECGGGQPGLALPLAMPLGQVFDGDVQSRAVGCGAASTSGRAALSHGVLAQLYHQDMEIDAVVRLEVRTHVPVLRSCSP